MNRATSRRLRAAELPGPGRARVGGGLVAAALAIVALATAPAVAQSPSGGTDATGAHLDLVAQTPFVAPTDILKIDLDVVGAPEGAELTFTLRSPVTAGGQGTTQDRFDAWVDGAANTSNPFNSPKTFAVANLPPADGSGRINAAFQVVPENAEEPLVGFRIADPGVYPLTVTLSAPDGGAELDTFTTYLVRLPTRSETAPPLDVATTVGIRAPVALQPDGSRSLDRGAVARIEQLVDTLDERAGVPLTIGATPETLEALIGAGALPTTGSSPAPTGASIIDQLEGSLAGRSILGTTYVQVDVPAWTRSQMQAPLAYQLSHGIDVTTAVLPAAAPLTTTTWVADPGLTPEALEQLRLLGVTTLALPEAVVGPVDTTTATDQTATQEALARPFDVEDASGTKVRTVTSSSRLAQRLVATDDEALNAQILVADLAVTYFGALTPKATDVPDTPRGVAFEVPDDALALRSLDPFLKALATVPPADGGGVSILAPTTLATLLTVAPSTGPGGEPTTRSFTPQPVPAAPEDMGDYPGRLEAAEFSLSAYESMVVDTQPERVLPLRQLLDVSGAAGLEPDERQRYLDASTATVDAEVGAVRLPPQDPVNLTATDQPIPIVVENDLTYPVTVRVELSSPKLKFPDGDYFDVQLEPGRNRLPVNVNTVSGGTFPLSIDLSTPDSRIGLGTEVTEVRSTAVSGVGLALTIGAGFFLLVWWARNWRNTRRTNRAGPPSPPPAPDPAPERPLAPAGFTVGPLDDLTETPTPGGDGPSGGADPPHLVTPPPRR